MKPTLTKALLQNNISLDEHIQQILLAYLDLIQTWNKVFNLTTITNTEQMIYLHLIDSLAVNPFLSGTIFLDVGSGAGLPGIPLAIINPATQWTLMDKNSKKTRFLTQAIAELKLNNVHAVHSRCEDFQPATRFDTILSRAFGSLAMFANVTSHLLTTNGQFLAMKGKYPTEELQDLPKNVVVNQIEKLDINGMNADRHIVIMTKKED